MPRTQEPTEQYLTRYAPAKEWQAHHMTWWKQLIEIRQFIDRSPDPTKRLGYFMELELWPEWQKECHIPRKTLRPKWRNCDGSTVLQSLRGWGFDVLEWRGQKRVITKIKPKMLAGLIRYYSKPRIDRHSPHRWRLIRGFRSVHAILPNGFELFPRNGEVFRVSIVLFRFGTFGLCTQVAHRIDYALDRIDGGSLSQWTPSGELKLTYMLRIESLEKILKDFWSIRAVEVET